MDVVLPAGPRAADVPARPRYKKGEQPPHFKSLGVKMFPLVKRQPRNGRGSCPRPLPMKNSEFERRTDTQLQLQAEAREARDGVQAGKILDYRPLYN